MRRCDDRSHDQSSRRYVVHDHLPFTFSLSSVSNEVETSILFSSILEILTNRWKGHRLRRRVHKFVHTVLETVTLLRYNFP